MSEGYDWTKPPFAKKVYLWPFGKTFGVLAASFLILIVAAISFTHGLDVRGWHTRDWVFITLIGPGLSLVTSLILFLYAAVELTPTTIRTMNDLSVRQTMRLDEIEKVFKPWYGLNVLLIVKSRNVMTRLWVPLFLQDFNDFKRSLAQVAPPDNPLRAFFEGRD